MSDEIHARNLLEHVPGEERLSEPQGSWSTPPTKSTCTAKPQEAAANLQLPDMQEVAPHKPVTDAETFVGLGNDDRKCVPAEFAQNLVDLDNMQHQRDFAMKVIKRLEQERDEAREIAARLAHFLERPAYSVDEAIARMEALNSYKKLKSK